jgi:transcription-repair coupling factor (superfamily II helicase)
MPAAPSPATKWEAALRPVVDALRGATSRPCLTGSQGAATAFALTLLTSSEDRSWLLVSPSDEDAERLYGDLVFFHEMFGRSPEPLALFPEWETLPYEATPPHVELIARRMRTLHRLASGQRVILVTSVRALLHRLLPRAVLTGACLSLAPGRTLEREALIAHLLRLGYRRTSAVDIPGEFSVRGGIVDVYSTAYNEPLRVELLGDTIESVRLFDQTTQQSTAAREEAWVLPARELISPDHRAKAEGPENGEEPLPPDAEWRGPDVYGMLETLTDYFAAPPVLVLDNPPLLAKQAAAFWEEIEDGHTRHSARPDLEPYPEPARLFLTWEEIPARTAGWPCLATTPVASLDASWRPAFAVPVQSPASVGLAQRGRPFTEMLAILDRLRGGGPVLLVARSRGQVDRLLALFAEHDLPAARWTPRAWTTSGLQKSPVYLVQGGLSAGFVSSDGRFAVLTEEELFAKGVRHRPPPKSKAAAFLASLEDLTEGDFVVHVQHGIARYRGLRRLTVQGFENEFLILEFAGGDRLYVPLDRLNQVQRYTGAEGQVPKLDRLGGSGWARTTARVKRSIMEMAQELVELYASREVVRRPPYGGDTTLTHAFEAAFEYEETEDQRRAIEDVKRDLESPRPMDRLVCGDVGYGKTEVAMRAAFKAVEDNRQVAVLVPTTILAQQHFDTFSQRFAPFPARVAMLSRFQTAKEIRAILKDLASGAIDVVIGTHLLLQKSVQFRNLGLVIIDEEQWFGVRHKEQLKQLRTQVDVLTLTATPIPRTLQMAMSGLRDLSIIETPPAGRLAIKTQVLRYNDTAVREAIIRELGRGGQVFYVYNRVQSLERMGAKLQALVPEARVVMAHGQMRERMLEAVMLKFLRREADVLVTSTIIQSGLDVPTANTILVHRADTFGLAQLYQLRGRVGRAGQQAYAYFLTPEEGELTPDAQKRLVAIQDFTELGSGFRIAAADMEIRGAGNLLGRQQSGHIAAIGLDLYLRMIEQAVQQIKGAVVEEEPEPTLHLNVSAFIPEDYVSDSHQRLALYRRLSSCRQVGDLALLHGEIRDRYGSPPEPVERLLEVMQVRILAQALRLALVEVKPGPPAAVIVAFDPKATVSEDGIRLIMDRYQQRFRLRTPLSFELQMPRSDWAWVFPELAAALQTLAGCDTKEPVKSA